MIVQPQPMTGGSDPPENCTDLISQVFSLGGYEAASAKLASKYPSRRKISTAAKEKAHVPPAQAIENLFV